MQLPEDGMPEWLKSLLILVAGAGGARWFSVYLENKRLATKEYRELLSDRIKDLEKIVEQLHRRMGNLRVEMAHLAVENKELKRRLGLCEADDRDENDPKESKG